MWKKTKGVITSHDQQDDNLKLISEITGKFSKILCELFDANIAKKMVELPFSCCDVISLTVNTLSRFCSLSLIALCEHHDLSEEAVEIFIENCPKLAQK